ncbi:serine hydrolase [Seonamhaeicola sp. MEBiC1930]|uniref:serine hydrolase n=1 Tax=Seonamhaeicola sp. MEBiC01930 TaxID=2976768 RepID=UPI0032552B5F
MKTKLLLTIVLSFFLQMTVYAQITEEDLMTNLQGVLDSKIAIYGMEGVAVTLVFPSNNIHTISSGYSTSVSNPVDVNKKWHWASGTKPLTGYVILDMYEEGLLDINNPISNYIDTDTIANVSGDILVKDLLQHTSPLQDVWDPGQTVLWNAVWSDRPQVWCPWEVLSYMPLPDNGNTTHNYNDSNSYMLGFIAEAIEGDNLETIFQNRIFNPLSMTNSYLSSCETFDMNELNGVWSGTENRSTWSHTSYLSSRGGNSALIAPIADVAKFYNTYYQGDLLTLSLMDELRTPAAGSLQNFGPIGCATSVNSYYGYETTIFEITTSEDTFYAYGHGGNGINNSLSYYWQEEDITIVLVTNDFTATNTMGALFLDVFCEINNNLPLQSLSTNEETASLGLLFPNPVQDELTIKLKISTNNNGRFILRDLNGREVLNNSLNNQSTIVSLINISAGMYIYEVVVDGRRETGKIIKN